jgi:DNA-binding winged helix-turn-helix (wHTH) protein
MNEGDESEPREFLALRGRFCLRRDRLYWLDEARNEVPVPLVGDPACRMLRLLLNREGTWVSNDDLITEGWPNDPLKKQKNDGTDFRVAMQKLRAGLGENAQNSCIKWERGRGYRYVAPPPEEEAPVPSP